MNDLIFAVTTVAPLLLVMAVGAAARVTGLLPPALRGGVNRLCYQLFLPALLIRNILATDLSKGLHVSLLAYVAVAICAVFALAYAGLKPFSRSRAERGALTHAVGRTNCAFFGLPLAAAIHPGGDLTAVTIAVAITVPLFNILSVCLLAACGEQRANVRGTLCKVAKNPLIIACVIGLTLKWTGIQLPKLADSVLEQLARPASPVALLVVGASLDLKGLRMYIRPLTAGVIARLIICPLLTLGAAVLLGFRAEELAAVLCIFAGPTAVNAYTLADQMGVEGALTARLVAATTLLSGLSVTLCLYMLRAMRVL